MLNALTAGAVTCSKIWDISGFQFDNNFKMEYPYPGSSRRGLVQLVANSIILANIYSYALDRDLADSSLDKFQAGAVNFRPSN